MSEEVAFSSEIDQSELTSQQEVSIHGRDRPPASMGDISTHVISKLGLPSVAHSPVRLFFNADASAGFLSPGWELKAETALSANGGNDTLVKMGDLACGLYLVEFDFSNVDAAARQIFRKADDGSYAPLNPNGFFLGSKLAITLKIEDATTYNHLVLSVGDKEITVRPGVRAH